MHKVVRYRKVLTQILILRVRGHDTEIVLVWKQSPRCVMDGEDMRDFVFVELSQVLAVAIVSHVESRQNLFKQRRVPYGNEYNYRTKSH